VKESALPLEVPGDSCCCFWVSRGRRI